MPYTRRSLIRDTALITAGAAAAVVAQKTWPRHHTAATFPTTGVRLFFAGAWLFGPDLDSSGAPLKNGMMRAHTINPGELGNTLLDHKYPYGVWDSAGDTGAAGTWDKDPGRKFLPTTYNASGSALTVAPHTVTVYGKGSTSANPIQWSQSKFNKVGDVFSEANTTSRLQYVTNTGGFNFSVIGNTVGIRIITLPFPTRIRPAAFRDGVKVYDPHNHISPCNLPSTNTDGNGIPTTHIFEYENASSMIFQPVGGQSESVNADIGFAADYHFHAVPKDPYMGHDIDMFNALFRLIQNDPEIYVDMSLDTSGTSGKVNRGNLVPAGVSLSELEISQSTQMGGGPPHGHDGAKINTLASCCNGGYGVCGC